MASEFARHHHVWLRHLETLRLTRGLTCAREKLGSTIIRPCTRTRTHMNTHTHTHSIYLSPCVAVSLSLCLSVYLFIYLTIYHCLCPAISIYLHLPPSIYLSVYLSISQSPSFPLSLRSCWENLKVSALLSLSVCRCLNKNRKQA